MADEEKKPEPPRDEKQPEPPKEFVEHWSQISQGDLGLKALYGNLRDGFKFRSIVGWITYNAKEVGSGPDGHIKHDFAALVISDHWWPTIAANLPGYVMVIPKDMTEQEVRQRLEENPEAAVNTRQVGVA